MTWPFGASSTTATSWPSGNCSPILIRFPDHCPTGADRPDDVRLRQCASAVFAASDRRGMFTVEANQQDPAVAAAVATSIETSLPFLVTLTAAAVTLSRLARSIADATAERCEPTMPAAPSTTISGV